MGRGSGRPVVLFADGDAAARLPLEVSLKDAGFDVLSASSEVDVRALLARRTMELVVADAELLAAFTPETRRRLFASDERGRIPLLLLATRGTLAERAQALDLAADDLLVRPVWSRELVGRVRLLLQRQLQAELASPEAPLRPVIEGRLEDIAVGDIVRSVESNRRSGTIHVRSAEGIAGMIYFRDGRTVDAELGPATGKDAIHRLLAFHEGEFAVTWGPVDRPDVVGMAPRALVLDGLRRLAHPVAPPPAAITREPGVERRGAVLSGTIQNNRGAGSTSVGWAPALEEPDVLPVTTVVPRPRNFKVAAMGAVVGFALVALLFLLPGRAPAPGEGPMAARAAVPGRPVITPVALVPARAPVEVSPPADESKSPVEECRDVSARGKPGRTVEVCTRAFLVLPDSARIAAILAHAELDQGHFELAGEWARKAVDINPSLPEPHAYLGFVADQAGRRREARASYRRYLDLAPGGPYAQDITTILGSN